MLLVSKYDKAKSKRALVQGPRRKSRIQAIFAPKPRMDGKTEPQLVQKLDFH